MQKIYVKMLGNFELSSSIGKISDSNNRTKKLWNMLAYIIYHQNRPVSRDELVELLWAGEDHTSNPVNALKTTLHRVRSMIIPLLEHPEEDFLLRDTNGVSINPFYELELDITHMNQLIHQLRTPLTEENKLTLYEEIFASYTGDFLAKCSLKPGFLLLLLIIITF